VGTIPITIRISPAEPQEVLLHGIERITLGLSSIVDPVLIAFEHNAIAEWRLAQRFIKRPNCLSGHDQGKFNGARLKNSLMRLLLDGPVAKGEEKENCTQSQKCCDQSEGNCQWIFHRELNECSELPFASSVTYLSLQATFH
jgi:hypothetical protein